MKNESLEELGKINDEIDGEDEFDSDKITGYFKKRGKKVPKEKVKKTGRAKFDRILSNVLKKESLENGKE
jgi:hypothetical protein